jgi:hypothetical protein
MKHATRSTRLAAVLAADRLGSAESAANELGLVPRSVQRWIHDPELSAIVAKTREESAESIRAVASLAWAQLAQRVADGQMEDRDLIILAGVATDKAQLVAGEATSRSEHRDITADLSAEDAEKLSKDISEWLKT